MGSYDGLPSLVAELRSMKARVAELERQQLGVARKQSMNHYQGPPDDGSFGTTPRTVATLNVDPLSSPMIAFASIGLASQGTTTSWTQVAVQLVNDGDVLIERRINLAANADIQHFGFSEGIPAAGSGSRAISIVVYVAAKGNPADPPTLLGNVVLDVLRVGSL